MNARTFDHHLGFWNRLLEFAEAAPKTRPSPKVAQAQESLRRLLHRRRSNR